MKNEVVNGVVADAKKQMKNAVLVQNGNFEQHTDSYSPRVFVRVTGTNFIIELLRDGHAIPWNQEPLDFNCWFIDVVPGEKRFSNVMWWEKL